MRFSILCGIALASVSLVACNDDDAPGKGGGNLN